MSILDRYPHGVLTEQEGGVPNDAYNYEDATHVCRKHRVRERTCSDAGKPRRIRIDLPWTNPPLTGNRTRGNPYARANEVRVAKDQAYTAIRTARVAPIVGANVTLCLRPATRHRRDADGLFPTLKVCQDALVTAGVLPDDSWVHIPEASCRIEEPDGQPAAMWLELSEVTEYQDGAA